MGKTAFQKIIDKHVVRVLPDGSMVLTLDRIWGHEITTPNAIFDATLRGCDVIFDPNKIKTMIDHVNPAKDTASAIQGETVRKWSEEHGIEFLEVGRNGVCHAVIPEKGWIMPGEIGIMGDSHTCTHSAFCAFTPGVGTTELENGIITGLWVCPPQKVIRVNFTGKLPANVFAKDLILTFINNVGVKGATNAVLEFGGNVIEEMGMEGRMTMSNMAVEAGATAGMIMVDKKTIEYLWPALATVEMAEELMEWNSDSDAEYDSVIDIDVTSMRPSITDNYSPEDGWDVANISGKPVDQVYIGSCTNGRLSDLRIAASVIKLMGGKIADNVRCIVVPATQHIYTRALQEGLLEIFAKAGCYVSGPTCGACLGMSCGVLAPGEVCVSTTNRNFPGRMGKDGMVHLASPATAALTAVRGVITEPDIELCQLVLQENSRAPLFAAVQPTGWIEIDFAKPDYAQILEGMEKSASQGFSGKVFYLPADNVDTDQIIPAKYLNETDKDVFGKHCLEDAPIAEKDRGQLYDSQILVAGENFGCGSSREHAPWALAGAGIRCVIASSFARIFENNMFANGLLCVTLSKENIKALMENRPETISVNVEEGSIEVCHEIGMSDGKLGVTSEIGFPISEYQKELIRNGGSVGVMLKLAAELQEAGKI